MKPNDDTVRRLDALRRTLEIVTPRHKALCGHSDPTVALTIARDYVRLARAAAREARELAKACRSHPDFDDLATAEDRERALRLEGAFLEAVGV